MTFIPYFIRWVHWSRIEPVIRVVFAISAAMMYGVTVWAWWPEQGLWWGRLITTTCALLETAFLAWLFRPKKYLTP